MNKSQINSVFSSKIKGNRDVTLLFVAVIFSIVVAYFFAGPTHAESLKVQKEIAAKQADLNSKKELLSNIQSFNKANQDSGVNSKKLTSFIPNRDNYEDFLTHVNETAKKSNVEVTSFTLVDNQKNGVQSAPAAAASPANAEDPSYNTKVFNLKEQRLSFDFRGNFDNIFVFMKTLENGVPFIQTESVGIKIENTSSGGGAVAQVGPNPNPILAYKWEFKFNYY